MKTFLNSFIAMALLTASTVWGANVIWFDDANALVQTHGNMVVQRELGLPSGGCGEREPSGVHKIAVRTDFTTEHHRVHLRKTIATCNVSGGSAMDNSKGNVTLQMKDNAGAVQFNSAGAPFAGSSQAGILVKMILHATVDTLVDDPGGFRSKSLELTAANYDGSTMIIRVGGSLDAPQQLVFNLFNATGSPFFSDDVATLVYTIQGKGSAEFEIPIEVTDEAEVLDLIAGSGVGTVG